MVSQFVIPSKKHLGWTKPYAFTKQGVAMLSSVLKSKVAIKTSVKIMRAFVQMRHFLTQNLNLMEKVNEIEKRQIGYELKTDTKLDKVLDALSTNQKPKQGIFYDGQIFDAFNFIQKKAKNPRNYLHQNH